MCAPEKLREVTGSHRNVSNVERDRRKCSKGILGLAIAGQSHITVAGEWETNITLYGWGHRQREDKRHLCR